MYEKLMSIQAKNAVLSGTLCVPDTKGPFPVVLMLQGSGPLDRNSNMKGQRLDIFNVVAHALADCGIASLRYDKRGCGSSTGIFLTAGYSDFVQDAMHCYDALAKMECVAENRIFILGHSEGCLVAAQVSLHRPLVAGLILLCPFIEPMESMLVRQAMQYEKEIDSLQGIAGFYYRILFKVRGSPSVRQQRLICRVKESQLSAMRAGFCRFPAKWLRELLALDVRMIFSAISAPMLLIAGEKDLQCKPNDAARIATVTCGQSTIFMVDNMTHTLRVDKNPASLLSAQYLLSTPISNVVYEASVKWIFSQLVKS